MKKILIITLIMSMMLTACGKPSTPTDADNKISETPTVSEVIEDNNLENIPNIEDKEEDKEIERTDESKEIKPLKSGIDITNIEDAVIAADFSLSESITTDKILEVFLFEQDIYDAVDIVNMKEGDVVIVSGKNFPVESVDKEEEFIDINGGYTASEYGMTFMPNEGGTYRTLLLDDYATYDLLGKVTIKISDDFELIDYSTGDFGDEGIVTDLSGLNDYIDGLDDWDVGFGYHNTTIHVVNNEIVQIIRRWVP